VLTLYRRAGLFELAGRIPVPEVADAVKLLGNALLIPWLTRQPRVLDAWIAGQRSRWEKLFRQEDVVERLRYYPLPLRRTATGERIKAPAPLHFRADLDAPRLLMQVVGPGGAGESTIAAQLGNWALKGQLTKHPLVPVWLDEDIDDLGAWLLRRVRAVSADDGLPEMFIQALFRRKRLLVIADRLSEKQAATQSAVRRPPGWLNALLVTSRTEQPFNLPELRTVEAVPLSSENLMGFVNDLLESRLDEDEAFRDFKRQVGLASRLAEVITVGPDEVPVTPLLVKLLVDQALSRAQAARPSDLAALPASVPEVYFDYLRDLNPDDPAAENFLRDDAMVEVAKVVARVELGDDFRPKRVPKTKVVTALRDAGFGDGNGPLQRLLDNQVLEQRVTGGTTLVAFALDPIAEYVAAFAHAEICAADAGCWQGLHKRVEASSEGGSGFTEALRVTREVFADELGWC
jgi:hypothetical protein